MLPEGVRSFFRTRWQGRVPLDRLFWRDLVLVGTLVSLAASAAALVLLGLKMPLWLVLAVHFASVPYSLFLMLTVWRTAEKSPGAKAWVMTLCATLWLVAMMVV